MKIIQMSYKICSGCEIMLSAELPLFLVSTILNWGLRTLDLFLIIAALIGAVAVKYLSSASLLI